MFLSRFRASIIRFNQVVITTEPIGFYTLSKLHIGPLMVLDFSIFIFKSLDGFRLLFLPIEPLVGVAASKLNNCICKLMNMQTHL